MDNIANNLLSHFILFVVLISPPLWASDDQVTMLTVALSRSTAARAISRLEQGHWVERGGLELIIGGPSSNSAQSYYGHISMHFVGSGPTPIEDEVVEAEGVPSLQDSDIKVNTKSVYGSYPIVLTYGSLGALIRSYYFNETRGYSRMIIPSTPELRRSLLQALNGINQVRTGRDRYAFLTQNCASYMAWVLQMAGFEQVILPMVLKPNRVSTHLRLSLLSPWPEIEGVSAQDLHRYSELTQVTTWSQLSTLDLQRLVTFRGLDFGARLPELVDQLNTRHDLQPTDKVYGIETLPSGFYQRDGGNVTTETIHHAFTAEQITHAINKNREVWQRRNRTTVCIKARAQCDHFNQVRQRLEAVDQ